MRHMAVHFSRRGRQIGGFGHHIDILLGVEQQPQATPCERVVVGKDDPDRKRLDVGMSVARRG